MRNKDIRTLLEHYEACLCDDRFREYFHDKVEWYKHQDREKCDEAIKALLRLEIKGIVNL